MTARELFEYLRERNAEDLPIMIDKGDWFDFLEDLDLSIYVDCVQID